MNAPILMDQTLREGEQAPGVSFSIDEKIEILKTLDELGVPQIEVGFVAKGSPFLGEIQELLSVPLKNAKRATSCRLNSDDIHVAVSTGSENVLIVCPCSEYMRKKVSGLSRAKAQSAVHNGISQYERERIEFGLVMEDVARASDDDIIAYIDTALECRVGSVFLSDTVGILTPERTARLFDLASRRVNSRLLIGGHFHNDIGLALANGLAAIQHGASIMTASINGLGERCGIVDLLQVTVALQVLYDAEMNMNIRRLAALSTDVENITGMLLSPSAPLVGLTAFTHSSGIHGDAQLKNEKIYEGADPSLLGRTHTLFAGKLSGRAVLEAILHESDSTSALSAQDLDACRTALAQRPNDPIRKSATEYRATFISWLKASTAVMRNALGPR